MRDRETIDSELRRIASMRRSIRERGGQLSSQQLDALLDERLGHRTQASGTESACETDVVAEIWRDLADIDGITPRRRKPVLRRVLSLAVLPLSLLAIATVLVVLFAVRHPDPSAQPAEVSPSSEGPAPAPPRAPPAPKAPAPPIDAVDMAFIAVLKHDGVPVPSHEYVMSHGHAVCEFLTHQTNFTDAVRFVQGSTVWDANQSAEFTAGAIASYCPQYGRANTDEMQQVYQNALSELQTIQGNLQGIQGDLQGIGDDLQAIPGHP